MFDLTAIKGYFLGSSAPDSDQEETPEYVFEPTESYAGTLTQFFSHANASVNESPLKAVRVSLPSGDEMNVWIPHETYSSMRAEAQPGSEKLRHVLRRGVSVTFSAAEAPQKVLERNKLITHISNDMALDESSAAP